MEEEIMEEGEESSSEPSYLEKKRAERERNVNNNEKALRATAAVLKDKGIPYASAIAAGVDAADKASGGRTTRMLGRALNTVNKVSPNGRRMQKSLNRLGESGATDAVNSFANKQPGGQGGQAKGTPSNGKTPNKTSTKSSPNSGESRISGEIKAKIPIAPKITIAVILLPIAFFCLAIFVLFGSLLEGSSARLGGFKYGETCTKITVENTGCDENGNDCTLVYDGEVELEDYVAGVVAAEVGNTNNYELYKLSAIVTRSFVFGNIQTNCKVEGNKRFKNYMDVNDSPNASQIKKAVEDTMHQIVLKRDALIHADYSPACVINKSNGNYQIRYGSKHFDSAKIQEIPISWDQNNSAFTGSLSNAYSQLDTTETNYENRLCPQNNNDYGLSQIGAYYLITNQNYSVQSVLEYYYGTGVSVVTNEMRLSGSSGFMNPTSSVRCSSPFGNRIHPVTKEPSSHSGLDIALGAGNPIYAASRGTVRTVVNNITAINNCNYGYGNYIIIDHENGVSTLYAHIKYGTIPDSLTTGSTVRQGDQIGEIGSTGCSTGPHLHYEVRENNKHVDPTGYMDLTGATGECKR